MAMSRRDLTLFTPLLLAALDGASCAARLPLPGAFLVELSMPPPANKTAKRRVLKAKPRQRKPAHEVRRHCLRVLVNDEEKADLQAQARTAKRSVGRYLREVGRGYQLKSTVDMEAVQKMARINGDMGRLGGLLKLYLKRDPRTAAFSADTIEVLLQRIAAQQEELGRVMQAVVRPAAQSRF